MKGAIIYSSLSGNTKKLAEKLAEGLSDTGEWIVSDLNEKPNLSEADCVLLGAWIDRSMPNKAAMTVIETLPDIPTGIFVTMGAMPDSPHGERVAENLDNLLKDRKSLGYVILPGKVDEKVIERVRRMPEGPMPEAVRMQMIEAGEKSRWATDAEYDAAINHIKLSIKNYF